MKCANSFPRKKILGVLILSVMTSYVCAADINFDNGGTYYKDIKDFNGSIRVTNGSRWEGELWTTNARVDVQDGVWIGRLVGFVEKGDNISINISSGSGQTASGWIGNATSWYGSMDINLKNAAWLGDLYSASAHEKPDMQDKIDVNLSDSAAWRGNAVLSSEDDYEEVQKVNLKFTESIWEGGVTADGNIDASVKMTDSLWAGSANSLSDDAKIDIDLNNSIWGVTKDSTAESLALKDSIVSVEDASLTLKELISDDGILYVDSSGGEMLNVETTARGNLQVVETGSIGASNTSNAVLHVNTANTDQPLNVTGKTEHGMSAYQISEEGGQYYFRKSGKNSNAGSVIQSMSAAPVVMASLHNDALSERQGAVRLSSSDNDGIWLSYFGGINRSSTSDNASFRLHANGVMLGGDTLFNAANGSWLAGVAVSTAKGNLSTLQSGGDIHSYGLNAYLTRQYDNGIFVDSSFGVYHFSNASDIRVMNKRTFHSDYSSNGFGAALKAGYHYQSENGVFVEPYARLSAMTNDSVSYTVEYSTIKYDAYNSVQGEVGGKLGMKFAMQDAEVNPYLQVAVLNEFANGNKVYLGQESANSSIDNTAVRMGAGLQASLTDNLGAYTRLSYLKGGHVEEPLQGIVGVNFTW